MDADGVEVCRGIGKNTTWISHVPSARVRRLLSDAHAAGEGDDANRQVGPQPLITVDGASSSNRTSALTVSGAASAGSPAAYRQRRAPGPWG